MGWDQEKDLNGLFASSCGDVIWSLTILPLVELASGRIEVFGSTAMRNSSLTTANNSFMIAIHGSIVFDELVGKRSTFRGFSDDI